VTREEAAIALSLVNQTFSDLFLAALRNPELAQKVEHFVGALQLAVTAIHALPNAPVVPIAIARKSEASPAK
jgi:hypothetical protein